MGFLLNSRRARTASSRRVSLEEINAVNDGKLRELNQAIDAVDQAQGGASTRRSRRRSRTSR